MKKIAIDMYFTPIAPSVYAGFRIPLAKSSLDLDFSREMGYTAKLVDFNRLVITTPHCTEEYVVSFELTGNDSQKMWERDTDANIRFWQAVERVVMARLDNAIRYINRHRW